MIITQDIAQKVINLVDQGLVKGMGNPIPGKMCVEAAVCFALGLPHGDDPKCVSKAVRFLKIKLNDSNWSSNQARAKGLRRLAVAQLGSLGEINDQEFAKKVAKLSIQTCVPIALRAAAKIQKDAKRKQALLDVANKCEIEGTRKVALEAKEIAADAADAAYAAAVYAADAAADAAVYAAYAAADAADARKQEQQRQADEIRKLISNPWKK